MMPMRKLSLLSSLLLVACTSVPPLEHKAILCVYTKVGEICSKGLTKDGKPCSLPSNPSKEDKDHESNNVSGTETCFAR